jgi:hypothetical protein
VRWYDWVGALSGSVTLLIVFSRFLARYLKQVIHDATSELRGNHGSSMVDKVDDLRVQLGEHRSRTETRYEQLLTSIDGVGTRVVEVGGRVDNIEHHLIRVDDRLDRLEYRAEHP